LPDWFILAKFSRFEWSSFPGADQQQSGCRRRRFVPPEKGRRQVRTEKAHLILGKDGMVLGHSSLGGKVAEHGLLLHIVSAPNRCLRLTYGYR